MQILTGHPPWQFAVFSRGRPKGGMWHGRSAPALLPILTNHSLNQVANCALFNADPCFRQHVLLWVPQCLIPQEHTVAFPFHTGMSQVFFITWSPIFSSSVAIHTMELFAAHWDWAG